MSQRKFRSSPSRAEAYKRFLPLLAVAGLHLCASNSVAGQDQTPAAPKVNNTPPATDVALGLGYHGLTRFTGSATLMHGQPKMLGAFAPAKLAQLRLGARGAQIGLGLVAGVFEDSPWKPSGVAVTLKAIAVRTWRDPISSGNGNTYAGLETDVVLLGFRGSIGYARKVAGHGGPDGRLVWSLGLGL